MVFDDAPPEHTSVRSGESPPARLRRVLSAQFESLDPSYLLARSACALAPPYVASRVITAVWRRLGFEIGEDAMLLGTLRLAGPGEFRTRLHIGDRVLVNTGCFFELNHDVTLGPDAAVGHDVMILTSTHQLGRSDRRAGAPSIAPVVIERGAWIGSRSVLFPGVTVGAGAVVGAGSVVNKDVPANCVVSGVPATVVVSRLPT